MQLYRRGNLYLISYGAFFFFFYLSFRSVIIEPHAEKETVTATGKVRLTIVKNVIIFHQGNFVGNNDVYSHEGEGCITLKVLYTWKT